MSGDGSGEFDFCDDDEAPRTASGGRRGGGSSFSNQPPRAKKHGSRTPAAARNARRPSGGSGSSSSSSLPRRSASPGSSTSASRRSAERPRWKPTQREQGGVRAPATPKRPAAAAAAAGCTPAAAGSTTTSKSTPQSAAPLSSSSSSPPTTATTTAESLLSQSSSSIATAESTARLLLNSNGGNNQKEDGATTVDGNLSSNHNNERNNKKNVPAAISGAGRSTGNQRLRAKRWQRQQQQQHSTPPEEDGSSVVDDCSSRDTSSSKKKADDPIVSNSAKVAATAAGRTKIANRPGDGGGGSIDCGRNSAVGPAVASPTKLNATAGRTKKQRLRAKQVAVEDRDEAAAAAATRSDNSSTTTTLQTSHTTVPATCCSSPKLSQTGRAGLRSNERKEVRFSPDGSVATVNSTTAAEDGKVVVGSSRSTTTTTNTAAAKKLPAEKPREKAGRTKHQRVRWSSQESSKADDDELELEFLPEGSVETTTTSSSAAAAKPSGRTQNRRTQFGSVANTSDRASQPGGGNDSVSAAKPARHASPSANAASSKASSPVRLNKRPLRTKNQRLRAKQLEEQANAAKRAAGPQSRDVESSQSSDASSSCSSGQRRATGLPPRPPSAALQKKNAKSHPLASVPEHAALPTSKKCATTTASSSSAAARTSSRGSAAQRVDIYTEQEAGNYQVLRDECLFLCSIITACTSPSTSPLSTAVELLSLLSDKKKRRALFAGHGDGEPLQAILSVFAWVQNAAVATGDEKSEVGSSLRASQSRQDDGCGSTQESPGNFSLTSVPSSNGMPKFAAADRQPLLDAIGMCLYFVSLDCTLSEYGAFSAAVASARRIRRAILSHAESLQGMLTLILVDPLTRRLRGSMPVMGAVQIDNLAGVLASPVASVQFRAKTNAMSVASTPTKDSPISKATLDTPDSKASSRSADPTLAGRRRGKKRRLERKSSKAEDDGLSFGCETPLKKLPKGDAGDGHSTASSIERKVNKTNCRLDQITLRILDCLEKTASKESGATLHNCSQTDHDASLISSSLPLIALSQIISGKAKEDERSCIDDDHGLEEEKGKEDDHNPIFETNRLLGENGAIPLLSQAVADTMVAVTQVLEQSNKSTIKTDGQYCLGCLVELEHRVSKLASLVDGASLLSDPNRRLLCEEGYSSETGGYLIVSLVTVLNKLLDGSSGDDMLFKGTWGEIMLLTLRTLTSLSHDNNIAARELETSFSLGTGAFTGSGLDVVARVLHAAVKNRNASGTDSKLMYDSTIFCLNILANAVESGASCGLVSRIKLPAYDGESELCFLTWLTRWLVGETRTFREAVMESTFGASPSKHRDRKLEAHEDEKLVTAGNGFVLLTCLLVDEKKSSNVVNGFPMTAHERIFEELPGDDPDAKMAYLKNTLKAFCNFYHYSLGGLSVAIVAPVKILIKRLDALQKKPSVTEEPEEEKKEDFAAQSP